MQKILFYFHGYGSNKNSTKVDLLTSLGYEVMSYDIDIDPDVSIPFLAEQLDVWRQAEREMVCIGTSLGAWYASALARRYGIKAVLINPSINPRESLKKYGLAEGVLRHYASPIQFTKLDTVVLARDDEVLDFSQADFSAAGKVIWSDTGGHRFNGIEFEKIMLNILEEAA